MNKNPSKAEDFSSKYGGSKIKNKIPSVRADAKIPFALLSAKENQ
jgi:hypothetical protein